MLPVILLGIIAWNMVDVAYNIGGPPGIGTLYGTNIRWSLLMVARKRSTLASNMAAEGRQ